MIYRVKKEGYGQIPQNVLSGSGTEYYFGQQWLDLNVKKNVTVHGSTFPAESGIQG
jgi:hypothetical protein